MVEQRLLEMITICNVATDLCQDLGVVPHVSVEATMLTTPTESGNRVEVAALISIKGREEKYLCNLPKVNELVSYLQEVRLQREEVCSIHLFWLFSPRSFANGLGNRAEKCKNISWICKSSQSVWR